MTRLLVGEQILIVEDEQVFRSFLDPWFSSLGVTTVLAADEVDALELLGGFTPDLAICDIAMPRMNELKLLKHIYNRGDQTPVLVIFATENMANIIKALCLGVGDILLKPIKGLNHLCKMVFACLYPSMFNSRTEEEEKPFRDWDIMVDNPAAATKLLQGLQPPVQQAISHCRANYRQSVTADESGLVLDITALSEDDLTFYYLNVTRTGHNGVFAVLLLRVLFNGLLQKQLAHQNQRLPESSALLKQVNHLLRQANLPGQSPLLVGYYHRGLKNLILAPAGLNVTLNTDKHQVQINNGVPLGTLGNTYLNQLGQRCDTWQCQIWGTGGRLCLMLSTE